jgi:pantetheine-phosphate adenylyltransferase
MDTAVYAGTFDLITNRHVRIIEQALKIFEKVIVVIVSNPIERTMFTLEQRLDIAKATLSFLPVSIEVLPDDLYLVDYAKSKNAKFLIRGIRDDMDINYEYCLEKANKKINSEIATIYLMPDNIYEGINSNLIKSLLGKKGWIKAIDGSIPKATANALKQKYVIQRFKKAAEEGIVIPHKVDLIIKRISEVYSQNAYHNYDHIIFMLEMLDMEKKYLDDNIMYLAAIMHDLDRSVEKCAKEAAAIIKSYGSKLSTSESHKDRIERLILATAHSRDVKLVELMKEDEKILASIDLMILASNSEDYNNYANNIRKEYNDFSDEIFNQSRKQFLESMLSKNVIFPSEDYEAKYGIIARQNMNLEIARLSV